MNERTIKACALAAVVLTASGSSMGSFKPSVKLRRHYTITNAAELSPVTTLVSQFLASECVNANTRRAYEIALQYFVAFACVECDRNTNTLAYSDLSRSLVTAFRDNRLTLEAPASADLRLRVVRTFCAWCSERFQVPHPAQRIASKFSPEEEFKGLTEKESQSVLRMAKADPRPLARFVPVLLLATGMRNDEARNLTLGQIDSHREWINKVKGKSTNPRDIPITDSLRHEMTLYLQWREEYIGGKFSPLLVSGRGKKQTPLDNKTIWRIVNDVCRRAKTAEDVRHPHAFRHTFAYRTLAHLEENGIKPGRALIILRDLLGHRDIRTTMRYLGNDKEENYNLLREML